MTVQPLGAERPTGPNAGIDLQPDVPVRIGVPAMQFDGTVPGTYGHTFVYAFRLFVLDVHGKVVFVEIDSDAPAQDPALLGEAMKILRSLRFTS